MKISIRVILIAVIVTILTGCPKEETSKFQKISVSFSNFSDKDVVVENITYGTKEIRVPVGVVGSGASKTTFLGGFNLLDLPVNPQTFTIVFY